MARKGGTVVLLVAVALVGAWLWRPRAAQVPPAGVHPNTPMPRPDAAAGHPGAQRPAVQVGLPGADAPSIAGASPAEIAALRDAESVRSKARPPVASYTGSDGKQHAFRYAPPAVEETQERMRDDRREELMEELRSDPAAFGRRYHLRAREMERILDGSADFPESMLD